MKIEEQAANCLVDCFMGRNIRATATARITAAIKAEQERCIATIRQYLLSDSQRAVSWHEVQDCIEAIRKGSADA